MQILPLKFIHEIDKKIVGLNLFNLAKLNRLGVPVIESVVVLPPSDTFKKIIEKYSRNKSLTDNIGNFKREILSLKMPESLAEIHVSYSIDKNKMAINLDRLWNDLLEKWLSELTSKIERQEKNLLNLTPQQVIFSSSFPSVGSAFFDEINDRVEIQVDKGKPDFKLSHEIEDLVLLCNKKLFLPQVYYWAAENGTVKIIKIAPFTQPLQKKEDEKITSSPEAIKKALPKTATKIVLDYKDEILHSLETDQVLLNVLNPDIDKVQDKLLKIGEFGDKRIIFFPAFENSEQKIFEYAKLFIFFRNKKNLNCQIVLPEAYSRDEFLKLKRDFAALGIYSKGSLKIWKQFKNIGDFLNVEELVEDGFDCALIDVDKIVTSITGVDTETFLIEPRKDWINSVEKFFKDFGFLKLIKNQKQVLISGKTSACEELLNFFIKSGVWGISSKPNFINALAHHVYLLEKNLTKSKTN